jgi:2-polyprenyl-3-methyl-5-hydroxy-6-metoxy-1,4-benzoquinol methylase
MIYSPIANNAAPIKCPLSGSDNVSKIQTISSQSLASTYRNSFLKMDIMKELDGILEVNFCHCIDSDLKFFFPAVTGSEKFYESLQKIEWYYSDEKAEYNYVKGWINSGSHVLEIGAGKGAFCSKIPEAVYQGLEFSKQAIRQAAQRDICLLPELIQEHATNHHHCYDVVCAFQVLEHVADVESFITSSLDCLKPNGLLIYSVPSADSFLSLWTNNILNMPPHHVTWWSDKALNYLGEKFGLEVLAVHHDRLAPEHFQAYTSLVCQQALRKIMKYHNTNILDKSFGYQLIALIGNFLSELLKHGLSNSCLTPVGHSVTAIYRKPL